MKEVKVTKCVGEQNVVWGYRSDISAGCKTAMICGPEGNFATMVNMQEDKLAACAFKACPILT